MLALAGIALRLAAPLWGEQTVWGLWPATYLPPAWRWGLAAVAAGLVLFGDRLPGWPTGLWRVLRFGQPWTRLILALASAVPFYAFRLRHLRWGDAYILVNAIPHPEVRLTYVWQAPLDVFLHAKAWAAGHRLFGWLDPTPVYAVLSSAAGVVFVWVLWGLADWLGRERSERVLLAGLVLTLGTMQLFFGYIENYTFMTLGVLIYLWLALRCIRGEIGLIWPATALALTHAFHPSTLVLAPSLLYVAHGAGGRPARSALVQLALPYLVIGGGVLALMTAGGHGISALLGADFPGGGDRRWFVPLFATTTRWEHYTFLSVGHLADIANQQWLSAPLILPSLILAAVLAPGRLPIADRAFRFLTLAAGLYLLLTLTWNPDYGGQRDWDLFAPAAVPLALLLGYVLPHSLPERPALRAAAWALIAGQAFALVAWVYQNTLPWSWPT